MRAARSRANELQIVQPGSEEALVIEEEMALLSKVQRALAEREIQTLVDAEYDQELVSLRDQISEAHVEDIAPLVAEMYRLQALGSRSGSGRSLPVDASCPYFGHLSLDDGKKQRHVLIGNTGYVPSKGNGTAIVDWRNAPVSKIYYRYDEGEDYEEDFGGRISTGMVVARRTVTISGGELRRITWSKGSVARRQNGDWVQLSVGQRPTLEGGAGMASRPAPMADNNLESYERGQLGVVGDESLRDDKRLQAITGLIDKHQFDLITKPDSGIVILQGGAGSGKTTVALHRAAYLHYQDPQVFSPKNMLIVVRSPALTEYIARVLPSLGVPGIGVITLAHWMRSTREKVLPNLKRPYAEDVPPAVAKLKKHPAIMQLLEWAVEEEAAGVREQMLTKFKAKNERKSAAEKWDGLRRLALIPRIKEMMRWLESENSTRAGLKAGERREATGVLRRSIRQVSDVEATWSDILTDRRLIAEAVEERCPGEVSAEEIRDLVSWVSMQADEPELLDDDDIDDAKSTNYGLGADGRRMDDGSCRGKFDEHDDALLLRLTQLKQGSLQISGSHRTVAYEHVVVDEAQDLSPTDVVVLKGALTKRQSMTLAGDTAQKLVFDNGFTDWKDLIGDLGITGLEIEPLRISYRSTREVMTFAQEVLGPLAPENQPIATRTGADVEQFVFGTTGEAIAFIGESLRSLVLRERRASVAVIARYAAQANMYYEGLKNAEVSALRRVYGKEFTFAPGIDVVDVAQIKGLEYDYIVLVEVNENTYPETHEARHLLHIASTRAVYQLWATSVGKPSQLLPESEV